MNLLGVLGRALYLYLIWRNLRDDYKNEDLVSYSWLSLLSFLIGGRLIFGLLNWGIWNDNWLNWLSFWNNQGFNYIGAVAVWGLVTWAYCEKFNWKMWALFEDVFGILYVFLAVLMLAEAVKNKLNLYWLTIMMVLIITVAIKRLVMTKYRSFSWYVSGKKGFAFFFANICLGLMLTAWCYLVAGVGIILSVIPLTISVSSIVGLFILGEIGGKK